MFRAARWAAAYTGECDAQKVPWENGLEFLKTVIPVIRKKAVWARGTDAALHVDGFLRAALEKNAGGNDASVTIARAILFILIKKGLFNDAPLLIEAIQDSLDTKERTLKVTLEAAEQPDPVFLEKLETELKEKRHASAVKWTVKISPEILGGYRMTIGSTLTDYSLEEQLRQMQGRLLKGGND
jgi:hypothetical protein